MYLLCKYAVVQLDFELTGIKLLELGISEEWWATILDEAAGIVA